MIFKQEDYLGEPIEIKTPMRDLLVSIVKDDSETPERKAKAVEVLDWYAEMTSDQTPEWTMFAEYYAPDLWGGTARIEVERGVKRVVRIERTTAPLTFRQTSSPPPTETPEIN